MISVSARPENLFSEINSLAIAIAGQAVTGSTERRHTGLFFKSEGDDLKLLHLGWHNNLKCDDPDPVYCWLDCEFIDQVVLDTIADWLSVVWKRNQKNIPYSIKHYDSDPFDSTGKLHAPAPGDGFTCSTFILWVFHHCQIDLIDKSTWEVRDEDEDFKQYIIDNLKKYNSYAKDHIEAQEGFVKSASRFRPEEVAGAAATYKDSPLRFDVVSALGQSVVDGMRNKEKL